MCGSERILNMKKFGSILSKVFLLVSLGATSVAAQEKVIGEIYYFGGNFCPRSSLAANGSLLSISNNTALFSILGTQFGGDGRTTFGLPDLRVAAPVGSGASSTGNTERVGRRIGGYGCPTGQKCPPSYNSFLVVTACIVTQGVYPSRS